MGSHNSDDPMDLGPFMQNYVLNNPFDLLKNPLESHPEASQTLQPNPANGDSSNSGSNRNSPVLPAKTPNEALRVGPATAVTEESVGTNYVVKDTSGLIVDTPKAHLGSNLAFAASLKNNLVSIGYVDVQDWLWNNYRHIPSYGAATSMATLLEHVQMYFPHITNIVLSRVMKFSFPDCNKFVNKQGAYYQSLVRRPDPQDYKDKSLLAAVDDVLEGRTTLCKAMASYAVEESRIIRMLVWEHNFMPTPSLSTTDGRRTGNSSRGLPGKKIADRVRGGAVNPERTSGRAVSQCLGSLEPLTGVPLNEHHFSDIDSSDLDMEEWITDGQQRSGGGNKRKNGSSNARSRRKSSRKRKRPSLDEDFEYALDTIIRSESEGAGSDHENSGSGGSRLQVKTRLRYIPERRARLRNMHSAEDKEEEEEDVEEVMVKIEQEDPGYADSSEHSHHLTVSDETSQDSAVSQPKQQQLQKSSSPATSPDCSSTPTAIKLSPSQCLTASNNNHKTDSVPDSSAEKGSHGSSSAEDTFTAASSSSANAAVCATPPDTSQTELMEELDYMSEKLQEQKQRNSDLMEEMGCARKEADALRSELSRRDLQFAVLAQEFFELNGHFQKMTHKFKQYMSTVLSKNEELGISSNKVGNLNGR